MNSEEFANITNVIIKNCEPSKISEVLLSVMKLVDKRTISKSSQTTNLNFTEQEIKKMPKLKDFTIRIKNNRYYEIRYRRKGINVSFSSKSFEEAKKKAISWLANFNDSIAENQDILLSKITFKTSKKRNGVYFIDFAKDYLYNIKKKRIKENTFKVYEYSFKNHISKMFTKKTYITDIKPIDIQNKLDILYNLIPRTCEDVKNLLSNIFNYAVDNGLIERNPMKAVYIPKHERQTGKALTPTQEKEFIKNIKGHIYENVFLKMLYTGVRPGELNSIQEDINNNTITIKNEKLKVWQKNLYRTIPMTPMYKTTLQMPITKKIDIDNLRAEFKKFLPNNTLKDLRHTFTTRAKECGVENELVAIWTGHSLGNITSSVYTHFSNEYQQKEALKVNYQ